ncbi:hypothetical protein [Oceanicaulis sp. MMSF_3324]|uniref:hypothetical protein n=1 Tax=Oceanicaulis sp. MMSF_3324 TaxID=3046702 RepID=UPI00273F1A23|nr:hypothetical protein [Oceanicaulis sp. MMSF_3324]
MRPVFRLPPETSLTAATDTDLRLFVAHQKYNTRTRRLAERELRRRMTRTTPSFSTLHNTPQDTPAPIQSPSQERPKGSLADIAWLGVILGAGALGLQIVSFAVNPNF